MERALYWLTGLILTGFFGFFAVWTYGDVDDDLTHTGLFWFSVAGSVVGLALLLVALVATGVAVGSRDRSRSRST